MMLKMGEKVLTVEYGFNSICILEELLGMGVGEIAFNTNRLAGVRTIRAFLLAGLYNQHPEIEETECGNLIEEYLKKGNTLDALSKRLTDCIAQSGFVKAPTGPNNTEKKRHG